MRGERSARLIKLILLCVLAAVANRLLHTFFMHVIGLPLFLDTVFTVAVAFAAGPWAGIAVALLTGLDPQIFHGVLNPFILCSIAEVLLVCWLKPANSPIQSALPERKIVSYVSIFAKLMLLYIVCVIAISILGGVIDFVHHTVLGNERFYFSAADIFKIGFLRGGIHILAANIFARIPVIMLDRIIVIFGGYFISLGIKKVFLNNLTQRHQATEAPREEKK